jgi:hypothetical protein
LTRHYLYEKTGKETLIVQIYVDDIVFGATHDSLSHEFPNEMKSKFEISMIGKLNFFLGIQVKQYDNEFLFLNQSMHRDIVKKFGMEGKNHARTPMSTSVKISSDPTNKCVDSTLYRSMIESLLYITATRPNIIFSVGV